MLFKSQILNYDDENQNFSTLSELQFRRCQFLEISDETVETYDYKSQCFKLTFEISLKINFQRNLIKLYMKDC